jgi:hypothetical protein
MLLVIFLYAGVELVKLSPSHGRTPLFVGYEFMQYAISEVPIGYGSLLMEKYVLTTRLQSIFKGRWTLARVFATNL